MNAKTTTTPGQRIRAAYEALGWIQTEAARRIGISPSTLSEIVSGESKLPSLEVGYRMAQILGVSLRWIIYGDDGELLTPTSTEAELLALMQQMPEDARLALIALARTLAKSKPTT